MKFHQLFLQKVMEKCDSLEPMVLDSTETKQYVGVPLKSDILFLSQYEAGLITWENGLFVTVENGIMYASWDPKLIEKRMFPPFEPYMDIFVHDKSRIPPNCPMCGTYMEKRIATYGKHSGQPIWCCALGRRCIGERPI